VTALNYRYAAEADVQTIETDYRVDHQEGYEQTGSVKQEHDMTDDPMSTPVEPPPARYRACRKSPRRASNRRRDQ
jgi:hypothetical protein